MKHPVENCGNCAFGVYGGRHASLGCRKRPPQVVWGECGSSWVDGKMVPFMAEITIWPPVTSNDFCGEFELKDAS